MAKTGEIAVRVADLDAFKSFLVRVHSFVEEYAWHTRECSAVDADGVWRRGNPACTCGYDEAMSMLTDGVGDKDTRPTLADVRALVDAQAEDEALWALNLDGTLPISEAYLQQELRRLHALIEAATS